MGILGFWLNMNMMHWFADQPNYQSCVLFNIYIIYASKNKVASFYCAKLASKNYYFGKKLEDRVWIHIRHGGTGICCHLVGDKASHIVLCKRYSFAWLVIIWMHKWLNILMYSILLLLEWSLNRDESFSWRLLHEGCQTQ